jgi:hypothetical protein
MTTVITYQLAYVRHVEVDLCDRCAADPKHGRGPLGPVQYGAHYGECTGARCVALAVESIVGSDGSDGIRVTVDCALADGITDPYEIAEIVIESRAEWAANESVEVQS